ncbi:MAG: hypothetical protein E7315_05665 [Clostridiales bacterium]|nr:hypothetical protein [Clostridiales bacterium]
MFEIKENGGVLVSLQGENLCVNEARVSKIPFNRAWPGKQRDISQTEISYFVSAVIRKNENGFIPLHFTVESLTDFDEAIVRPLSKNITPLVCGRKIELDITQPGQYTVERDGIHNALCIFVDEEYSLPETKGNIIYFGRGEHDVGLITLKSSDTLFVDEGAVVYATIEAYNSENIRITGRGIIDNSHAERLDGDCLAHNCGCLRMQNCRNVTVDNVIFRDSAVWMATMLNCENVVFDNIKGVGMWRYNSDGIDLVNCSNCVIRRCFLRNFDDVIVLKGIKGYDHRNVENIFVSQCVVWCDWGRGLEIGAETCADEYRNIIFEDCDLIHGCHVHLDIQNGDRAHVHDVVFRDIRCEYVRDELPPVYQESDSMEYDPTPLMPYKPLCIYTQMYCGVWSDDNLFGEISNIKYENIRVYTHKDDNTLSTTWNNNVPPCKVPVYFTGATQENPTHNITVENLIIDGENSLNMDDFEIYHNENAFDIIHK